MNKLYASLKGIAFLILLMVGKVGMGQQPTFSWAKSVGGTNDERGYSISTDAAGNVYTTGRFYGTTDFDPSAGNYSLTSVGNADIFISKLDASGNFIWAKQMGGTSDDWAVSIAIDGSGNIYTTGWFDETADFNPGPGSFNLVSTNYGFPDVFISKLDASGNFVWAEHIGGILYDNAWSIAVNSSGDVFTSGHFSGTTDFNPGAGVYNLTSGPGFDMFISKLSASGNFVWAKITHSSDNTYCFSIALDALGNVLTTGLFSGTNDFDPGAGTYTLESTTGVQDIFICKLDASGNFVWARKMGGINYVEYDKGYCVKADANGNVYITGKFQGTTDFDPGVGVYNLTSAGDDDIFISKLDASGNFVWAKRIGGSGTDQGISLAFDQLSNVYTTGYFQGTTDFDPGIGTHNISSNGNSDIFISKLDVSGNFIWAQNIGSVNPDGGQGIFVDLLGNICVTGYFSGTADFDASALTYNLTSLGGNDVFVVKLGQTTLPLHLLTFTAKKANNTNLLNWTTAQEVNTDLFEIERSYNGREFNKIGVVKANGMNGQYSYTDNNPTTTPNSKPQTIFYRLKMLDKDGKFEYSPIRQLTINNSQFTINIFPNPTHNKLQIQIDSDKKTTLKIDIITQDGKIVLNSNMAATVGSNLHSINITALQSGTYILRVTSFNPPLEGREAYEQSVVKFEKAP